MQKIIFDATKDILPKFKRLLGKHAYKSIKILISQEYFPIKCPKFTEPGKPNCINGAWNRWTQMCSDGTTKINHIMMTYSPEYIISETFYDNTSMQRCSHKRITLKNPLAIKLRDKNGRAYGESNANKVYWFGWSLLYPSGSFLNTDTSAAIAFSEINKKVLFKCLSNYYWVRKYIHGDFLEVNYLFKKAELLDRDFNFTAIKNLAYLSTIRPICKNNKFIQIDSEITSLSKEYNYYKSQAKRLEEIITAAKNKGVEVQIFL